MQLDQVKEIFSTIDESGTSPAKDNGYVPTTNNKARAPAAEDEQTLDDRLQDEGSGLSIKTIKAYIFSGQLLFTGAILKYSAFHLASLIGNRTTVPAMLWMLASGFLLVGMGFGVAAFLIRD